MLEFAGILSLRQHETPDERGISRCWCATPINLRFQRPPDFLGPQNRYRLVVCSEPEDCMHRASLIALASLLAIIPATAQSQEATVSESPISVRARSGCRRAVSAKVSWFERLYSLPLAYHRGSTLFPAWFRSGRRRRREAAGFLRVSVVRLQRRAQGLLTRTSWPGPKPLTGLWSWVWVLDTATTGCAEP